MSTGTIVTPRKDPMRKPTPPKPDDLRAFIEAELTHARSQRDAAQQRLNDANTASQQAQQNAQAAQAMILTASGAVQQCEAILSKMNALSTAVD